MSRTIAPVSRYSADLSDAVPGLTRPEFIVPAQFFKPRRSRSMPEEALVAAVLEDAINCVHRYRHARDRRGQRLFREEEDWFLDEDKSWPFSFERLCEVLGLDAESVRQAVLGDESGSSEEDTALAAAATYRDLAG